MDDSVVQRRGEKSDRILSGHMRLRIRGGNGRAPGEDEHRRIARDDRRSKAIALTFMLRAESQQQVKRQRKNRETHGRRLGKACGGKQQQSGKAEQPDGNRPAFINQ